MGVKNHEAQVRQLHPSSRAPPRPQLAAAPPEKEPDRPSTADRSRLWDTSFNRKFVFSHPLVMSSMDRTGKKTPEGAGHTRRYCTERAKNGCRCAMKAWRCSMCDARPRNSPKSNDFASMFASCALLAQRKRRPSPVSSLPSMFRPLRPCLRDWSVRFRVQSRYIICTTDEPSGRTVIITATNPLSVLE